MVTFNFKIKRIALKCVEINIAAMPLNNNSTMSKTD